LLFASAQIGSGEVPTPVIDQRLMVLCRRTRPDSEVHQLRCMRFAAGQKIE